MKTRLSLTALAVMLLGAGSLRADINNLATLADYADQLLNHGVNGGRFVELVDERYYDAYPTYREYPGRGMGTYVQELHARGLRGRALADAIHAEQQYRVDHYSKPLSPGQAKKMNDNKPLPPGQAKKLGIPPGQLKLKPKEKAAFFGPENGHGKGKKK